MGSDVYSFCMVLWHLLSRQLPFQEDDKDRLTEDIIKKEKVGFNPEWHIARVGRQYRRIFGTVESSPI